MTWIDIAGRWLIIGLGTAAGFALLVIAWGYCLTWFVNGSKYTKHLMEYLSYRDEFREWKKRPSRHKMSKEEEEEYKRIHAGS